MPSEKKHGDVAQQYVCNMS